MLNWLISTVIISGLLSAVAFSWPQLVVLGYFLFVIPGLILTFAPAIFSYSLLLLAGLLATQKLGKIKRTALLVAALGGVAFGIPAVVNAPEQREQVRLTSDDSPQVRPAPDAKSIAIVQNLAHRNFYAAPEREKIAAATTCSDLCLRLLYNGSFEEVTMAMTPATTLAGEPRITEAISYRLEPRPACLTRDYENIQSWPTDPPGTGGLSQARIRSRMAAGECVIAQAQQGARAELTLTILSTPYPTGRFHQPDRLNADTIQAHRLELRRAGDSFEASPWYRKTLVTLEPLSTPLTFGMVDGGSLSVRAGFGYRRSYGTSFDREHRYLEELFGTRIRLPDPGAPEDVRERLATALAAQKDSAPLQELADALFQQIQATRQVSSQDIELIGRIVDDPRMTGFSEFHRSVWILGSRLDPIAPQIMRRMLNPPMTDTGDPGDRVNAMAYAVTVLSTEGVKSIGPDLFRLLDMPFTRGRGAQAITRLGDLGPEGVQKLLNLQQVRTDSGEASYGRREEMAALRRQALKGLCLVADQAPAALELMTQLLRSEVERHEDNGLDFDGRVAAGALAQAGQGERLRNMTSKPRLNVQLNNIAKNPKDSCRL